jgi:hypothetical protein
MLNYFIKNTTPYIGDIKLKVEKYPHYSGGKNGILNKVHFNLSFTKIVSRMVPKRDSNGYMVDKNKIAIIESNTGGKIGSHKVDPNNNHPDWVLHDSFLTMDGKYVGDIQVGWWYVKKNYVVTKKRPNGVAMKLDKKGNVIGYYGYTHRGGALFKIGDKLFDENWVSQSRDTKKKSVLKSFFRSYNVSTEDSIPFQKRGSIIIENLDQAEQAAINLSEYLG